jgi:tripartite-type tricarboxylate transporter receptor subunit TctC
MNIKPTITRRQAASLLGGILLTPTSSLVNAQSSYPSKPVKIVVTYATGGANDLTARIYALLLGDKFKQSFIVDNRPGASGVTGTVGVARGESDGYTLLLGAGGTMTINPVLLPNLPYDPLKDFAPIGLAAQSPLVVLVPPNLPVNSIQELIRYAKSRKEGISYASPGAGTPLHLAAEMFMHQASLTALHVPYKGSAPALTDLMAGRVDVMFDVQGSSLQFVRAGKLRALAVTSMQRSTYLPEVPTLHESGLKDFDVTSWFAFFAPIQTPPDVVAYLSQSLQAVAQTPEASARLAPLGMSPVNSTPQALREMVQKEQAKWRDIIKRANIKSE